MKARGHSMNEQAEALRDTIQQRKNFRTRVGRLRDEASAYQDMFPYYNRLRLMVEDLNNEISVLEEKL